MNDSDNSQQHGVNVAGDSSGSSSSSNNAPPQNVLPAASVAGSGSGDIRRLPSPQESRIGMIRLPPTTQPQLEAATEETAGKRKRGGRSSDAGASGSGSGSSRMKFDGPDVASPCSVCGKRFGSWKALFGHMRSHPERPWRGVHPPPTFNREGSPEHQQQPQPPQGPGDNTSKGEETGAYLLRLATQVKTNMEKRQRLSSSGSPGEDEGPSSAASPTRPRRGLNLDLNEPYVQAPSTPPSDDTDEGGFSLDLNFPPASPQS